MDTHSRQRLRPWLESRINSGQIPGLTWLNVEKQIFRVPWKHGGKHDWNEQDSLIFKVFRLPYFLFIYTCRHRGKTHKNFGRPKVLCVLPLCLLGFVLRNMRKVKGQGHTIQHYSRSYIDLYYLIK